MGELLKRFPVWLLSVIALVFLLVTLEKVYYEGQTIKLWGYEIPGRQSGKWIPIPQTDRAPFDPQHCQYKFMITGGDGGGYMITPTRVSPGDIQSIVNTGISVAVGVKNDEKSRIAAGNGAYVGSPVQVYQWCTP